MSTSQTTISYPAVLERASGEMHELRELPAFLVGRSQDADLPVLDTTCSRRHFRLVKQGQGYALENLSETRPTLLNGQAVRSTMLLSHGAVIKAGASEFVYLLHDDLQAAKRQFPEVPTIMPSPPPLPHNRDDRTMFIDPTSGQRSDSGEEATLPGIIPIQGVMLIGRDKQRVAIHLPHSQVSRMHAQIVLRDRIATVIDLNSANGTYVNGSRVQGTAAIKVGDHIDIGPYALIFNGTTLTPKSRANNVELACRNLSQIVKSRDTGRDLTLLDNISLVIEAKKFVCILGPSGCGKSTLLSALSARKPAVKGTVTINGEGLYTNFEALKRDIALVPQKDILHQFLTVRSALRYTARLRLPPDTSNLEIDELITKMLKTVGLESEADKLIRDLSGGQARRASLANEIISNPSLLFLDEVTSGLDEETDESMMKLFANLAKNGKTIVCITHSLTYVQEHCDRLVILAKGGNLAFIGSPDEALAYFGISRLGQIYGKLKSLEPSAWKQKFESHPNYRKYVLDHFAKQDSTAVPQPMRRPPTFGERTAFLTRQCSLLTSRYFRAQMADLRSLMMTLGQCLLVGFLIMLLFGDITAETMIEKGTSPPESFSRISAEDFDRLYAEEQEVISQQFEAQQTMQVMFLLAISVLWFGCNNAAKEIVKEKVIYSSERDINLAIPSYLASKVMLLGIISLIQTVMLVTIVKYGTGVACGPAELMMLLTLAWTGVALGLLVSAAAQSTDMAVTIVPLILIPQIIFSGMIAEVSGFAKLLASLSIVTYWGHGGLVAMQPEDMREMLGYKDWSAFPAWIIISFHGLTYLVAAFVVLQLGSSREPVYRKALDRLFATKRA